MQSRLSTLRSMLMPATVRQLSIANEPQWNQITVRMQFSIRFARLFRSGRGRVTTLSWCPVTKQHNLAGQRCYAAGKVTVGLPLVSALLADELATEEVEATSRKPKALQRNKK